MSDAYPARLCGGPHDGDEAMLDFVPLSVWVFACGTEPVLCPMGGIHWAYKEEQVSPGVAPARYDLDPDSPFEDEELFEVFRYVFVEGAGFVPRAFRRAVVIP